MKLKRETLFEIDLYEEEYQRLSELPDYLYSLYTCPTIHQYSKMGHLIQKDWHHYSCSIRSGGFRTMHLLRLRMHITFWTRC